MICDKNKCTGCFACYNVCPKSAIDMIEDENGFIYPQINQNKCIECGLCKKICPSINHLKKEEPKRCFAMYAKDSLIREKSTSGGVATIMSKLVLKDGGIVYGCSFEKNCSIKHIRVIKEEDLAMLQGSKYVHSYIGETFKQVKSDLKDDKRVLFIGTPCQIAGLRTFLKKEYNNLILVDIICHGVPSQKYLKEEVQRVCNTTNIDKVKFREQNSYGFYVIKNKKMIYSQSKDKSPYCDSFMLGLSLRDNCHSCLYATKKRVSDVTIGDFWGIEKFYPELNDSNGISLICINSEKGLNIFNEIKENRASIIEVKEEN